MPRPTHAISIRQPQERAHQPGLMPPTASIPKPLRNSAAHSSRYPMTKNRSQKSGCGERKERNHPTDNSEANRFICMSASVGSCLRYLVNCATIIPAAILAQ